VCSFKAIFVLKNGSIDVVLRLEKGDKAAPHDQLVPFWVKFPAACWREEAIMSWFSDY